MTIDINISEKDLTTSPVVKINHSVDGENVCRTAYFLPVESSAPPKENVCQQPAAKQTRSVVTQSGGGKSDVLFTHTAASDALEEKGIESGDVVICKKNYNGFDLKEGAICILDNGENGYSAMILQYNGDGGITFYNKHNKRVGLLADFLITGVVTALQRSL